MNSLGIIAILALIPSSLSCSCGFVGVEHYYCYADFVIKANITAKTVIKTEEERLEEQSNTAVDIIYWRLTSYNIDVHNVYKASEAARSMLEDQAKIWADKFAAQCGIQYSEGDIYVIAGGLNDNKLWAPACGYSRAWQWMSDNDKQFFDKHQYKTLNCSSLTRPF